MRPHPQRPADPPGAAFFGAAGPVRKQVIESQNSLHGVTVRAVQ
jgi:hypothetical protein